MAIRKSLLGSAPGLALLALSSVVLAQTDPGVRPGAINGQTGATTTSPLPLASVTSNTPQGVSEFFQNGLGRFQEVESVSGGANNGLDLLEAAEIGRAHV